MTDKEKKEIELPVAILAHAKRMAVIISLISRNAKSPEEAEDFYVAYIRQVIRYLIALGRKPDAAVELAVATYRISLDEIEKATRELAAAKEAAADAPLNVATQEAFEEAVQGGEYDRSALGE